MKYRFENYYIYTYLYIDIYIYEYCKNIKTKQCQSKKTKAGLAKEIFKWWHGLMEEWENLLKFYKCTI